MMPFEDAWCRTETLRVKTEEAPKKRERGGCEEIGKCLSNDVGG
jgi:hypothetical protein